MLNEALIFSITLVAGSLGSTLGLGGGFFIIPASVLILGLPMHEAVSLSLASISGIAFSSFLTYAKNRLIDFKLGVSLELFTVLGAIIGSTLAIRLSNKFLEVLFGMTLMYVAFRMIRAPAKRKEYELFKGKKFLFACFSSLLAGLIASMIGIGGGVLKVPIMNLILNVPIRIAMGTSEFMITITSFTATVNYHLQGVGDIYHELFGIAGGFLGGQLGSRTGLKLKSSSLKKLFASVLLCFSILMIIIGVI